LTNAPFCGNIYAREITKKAVETIKREKIDGRIYLVRPSGEHRDVQANLTTIFNSYFKKNNRRCRAVSDHELYLDEDNFFEPDIKVLCRETRSDDMPVIVVEVLSKSTRARDLGPKMKKYAELGIKQYWIVTWETLSIDIYLLSGDNIYELYRSYAHFTSEAELKRLDEEERQAAVGEFSPPSFPELVVRLEDVFDIFE